MSLPKKGSRKISIENVDYRWIAKGNGQAINLTIAPIDKGCKLLASFDYNTEYKESNAFVYPFVITPYIVRQVLLFANENGYSPQNKRTQLNLGNLTQKLDLDLSGERKTKKLIRLIEIRMASGNTDPNKKATLQYILKETKSLIKYGEWFVGFEMMVTNLYEIDFKVNRAEFTLMQEIFKKAGVDWRVDWKCIEEMKKEDNM